MGAVRLPAPLRELSEPQTVPELSSVADEQPPEESTGMIDWAALGKDEWPQ